MGVGQVQTTLGAVPREIGGDGDERRLGLVAARGGIFVLSALAALCFARIGFLLL